MTTKICFCFCFCMMLYVSTTIAQDDSKDDDEPSKRPSWSSGLPERQSTKDLNSNEFKPDIDDDVELDMSEFGIKPKAIIELPIESGLPTEQSAEAETPETIVEEPNEEKVSEEIADELKENEPEAKSIAETQDPIDFSESEDEVINEEQTQAESEEINPEEEYVEDSNSIATSEDPNEMQEIVEQDNQQDLTPEQDFVEQVEIADTVIQEPIEQDNNVDLPGYKWKIIKQAPVKYPVKAALDNIEGWVDVEVTINPSGEVVSVSTVKFSRKGRVFSKPAVQSVNNWLFDPPNVYGIDENQSRIYRIEFNL